MMTIADPRRYDVSDEESTDRKNKGRTMKIAATLTDTTTRHREDCNVSPT
jgi:hypothetical protein